MRGLRARTVGSKAASIALALAVLAGSPRIDAQDGPPKDAPSAREPPAPSDPSKAKALEHFQVGLELSEREAWDAALAAFLESRRLFPTRVALKNAAICLDKLNRFDEALDMYDEMVERFGEELTPDDRKLVADANARLGRFVGVVEIASGVDGATVAVDGKSRGTTPLPKGIRVTLGTHRVRVTKAGYVPYEETVSVASRETKRLDAKLQTTATTGELSVTEKTRRKLPVILDGQTVGTTPWSGSVLAGRHRVQLRGERWGAATSEIDVEVGKKASLALTAERLTGSVRIFVDPPDAEIALDGREPIELTDGRYATRLPTGAHRVELDAYSHYDDARDFGVSDLSPTELKIGMSSVDFWLELCGGLAEVPLQRFNRELGGDPGDLDTPIGAVFQLGFGFRVLRRLQLGVFLGFVGLDGKVDERRSLVTEDGIQDVTVEYETEVLGPTFLASAGWELFDRTPLNLRLVGGGVGTAGFAYRTSAAGAEVKRRTGFTLVPVIGPEVRFGYRFGTSFTMDLGLAALGFFPGKLPYHRDDEGEPACCPPVVERPPQADTLPTSFLVLTSTLATRFEF